jgi:hypothetical protein
VEILGIKFVRPTLSKIIGLLLACFIVTGMIYGIGTSIDDGSVTKEPELLRHIIFWPFSLVLAIRFAHAFGLSENLLAKKFLMVLAFYMPVGLALAIIGGLV